MVLVRTAQRKARLHEEARKARDGASSPALDRHPMRAILSLAVPSGAAYGLMVAVFQWGWGADLIGVTAGAPIEPFLPIMMFAIVFGLSLEGGEGAIQGYVRFRALVAAPREDTRECLLLAARGSGLLEVVGKVAAAALHTLGGAGGRQVVLVVGASAGIGRAVAVAAAEAGARVAAAARRSDRLEALVSEMGGGAAIRLRVRLRHAALWSSRSRACSRPCWNL